MISRHFKREELACKCGCGQDTVDAHLLKVLDRLRDWAGVPVIINSGNRCEAYNTEIGGHPNSFHIRSKAADVRVSGVNPSYVARILDEWYPGMFGIGDYLTFTHIDVQPDRKRW